MEQGKPDIKWDMSSAEAEEYMDSSRLERCFGQNLLYLLLFCKGQGSGSPEKLNNLPSSQWQSQTSVPALSSSGVREGR